MDLVEARKKAKQLKEKSGDGAVREAARETIQVEAQPEPKKAPKNRAAKKTAAPGEIAGPGKAAKKKIDETAQPARPAERPVEKPGAPEKEKGEPEVFVDMNFGEDLPGIGEMEKELVLEAPKPKPAPGPKPDLKKEVEFMKQIAREMEAPQKPSRPPVAEKPAAKPRAESNEDSDKEFYDLVVEDLVQYGYGHVESEANLVEYLSFRVGTEIYAVPLTRIQQIIKPRPVTLVPGSPHYILGIISLRGMVIPVFDLRRRLGLEASEPGRQSRIIITKLDELGVMTGILVDQVNEVARVPGDSIEATPPIFSGIEGEFLAGIIRYKGQMLIVLDLVHVVMGKKEEGKG